MTEQQLRHMTTRQLIDYYHTMPGHGLAFLYPRQHRIAFDGGRSVPERDGRVKLIRMILTPPAAQLEAERRMIYAELQQVPQVSINRQTELCNRLLHIGDALAEQS